MRCVTSDPASGGRKPPDISSKYQGAYAPRSPRGSGRDALSPMQLERLHKAGSGRAHLAGVGNVLVPVGVELLMRVSEGNKLEILNPLFRAMGAAMGALTLR